jgi:hypothetical protein
MEGLDGGGLLTFDDTTGSLVLGAKQISFDIISLEYYLLRKW